MGNRPAQIVSTYLHQLSKWADFRPVARNEHAPLEGTTFILGELDKRDPLWLDQIRDVYKKLVDREPNLDESVVIEAGTTQPISIGDIIASLLTSNDYTSKRFPRGFLATEGDKALVVRDLYKIILGREPDPDGLRHYSRYISSLPSASAVVRALLESYEYKRRNARLGLRRVLEQTFDVPSYLHLNPDLRGMQMEPVEHFLRHGVNEGRSTGPDAGQLELTEADWFKGSATGAEDDSET